MTRHLKEITWRVTEYNLSASSCDQSSTGSYEERARVQLSKIHVCDSEPQSSHTQWVESGAGFDDYAPSTSGYVQTPSRGLGSSRNNNQVLSGSIVKHGISKILSPATTKRLEAATKPELSHWRVKGPNWACPLAVHDPSRYWEVGNACIEWQGFSNIARVR